MSQGLFDFDCNIDSTAKSRPVIEPRDPGVTDEEKPRLRGQCLAILERLRQGPATNRELAAISLKYTGRISDLRRAGYAIPAPEEDRVSGHAVYRLLDRGES